MVTHIQQRRGSVRLCWKVALTLCVVFVHTVMQCHPSIVVAVDQLEGIDRVKEV